MKAHAKFLLAGLRETGWDRYLNLEFVCLRDLKLPNDASDSVIWHVAQTHRLLLLTDNRNREDEDSLEAVIQREGTPEALPVLTVASVSSLPTPAYRQAAVHKLAEIVTYIDNYVGVGRVYLP